jgi:Ser/Thr protein kinase RdoA (MazF antagonist)
MRQTLEKTLDRFNRNVVPVLGDLRSQIIHADLNRGNVLISTTEPRKVSGIIDFGDMVHTPLIMDLAIAAAYHLADLGDPLGNALHFISGYHEVTPLEPLEVEILLDLMLARLCTSITVQTWRAKLYPENSDYLLVHNSYSKRTLKYVTSCKHDEISARIREICRI